MLHESTDGEKAALTGSEADAAIEGGIFAIPAPRTTPPGSKNIAAIKPGHQGNEPVREV